jgi:hypothetical protein
LTGETEAAEEHAAEEPTQDAAGKTSHETAAGRLWRRGRLYRRLRGLFFRRRDV